MHFSARLAGAALTAALAADAFLITPDLSDKAIENAKEAGVNFMSRQTVTLGCQDCDVAFKGASPTAELEYQPAGDRMKMAIELDFTVEGGSVLMNGAPFYPPFHMTGSVPFFHAKQAVSGEVPAGKTVFDGDLPISNSMAMKETLEIQGDNGNVKIHPVSIELLGMSNKPVHVPTIELRIAELPTGKLILLPIETTPYEHDAEADQCKTTFCRVRVTIARKIAALRAAAMARFQRLRGSQDNNNNNNNDGAAAKTEEDGVSARPNLPFRLHGGVDKFKNGHMRGPKPHHHRPHHHKCNRFRGFVRRFLHHFVLPVLFGVATGMLVGAAAMLVFSAASAIYVRACGRRAPVSEALAEQGEGEGELDARGLPPKYEDVYVEPEEDVTSEKKPLL